MCGVREGWTHRYIRAPKYNCVPRFTDESIHGYTLVCAHMKKFLEKKTKPTSSALHNTGISWVLSRTDRGMSWIFEAKFDSATSEKNAHCSSSFTRGCSGKLTRQPWTHAHSLSRSPARQARTAQPNFFVSFFHFWCRFVSYLFIFLLNFLIMPTVVRLDDFLCWWNIWEDREWWMLDKVN